MGEMYGNWGSWAGEKGPDEVYDTHAGSPHLGLHAIKISGYGISRGKKYWLVQNSWGSSFGDGGYIKMLRNTTTYEQHRIIQNSIYWAMPVLETILSNARSSEAEPLPGVSPLMEHDAPTGKWLEADHNNQYFQDL